MIKATGQAKQKHFLDLIDGLILDNKHRIVVDALSFQCTNPKYFAGGDAVNGGAEVVNAAYDGKMAARPSLPSKRSIIHSSQRLRARFRKGCRPRPKVGVAPRVA